MDSKGVDARHFKDLGLSTEELSRFERAMKDPKFVGMLGEYAKEMADPKQREENEQYLRQLEREGQGGAAYGKDTELVAPNAGFCVKTKNKTTGAKAFINICHSDKIATSTSNPREDGTGADWSIPYSLSSARTEKDKAGKDCEAHDFVIASSTYERCQTNHRFKTFVIETALDSVEAQRKCKLERSFTLPKLRFKGPRESPPVLAVKASGKHDESKTTTDSPVSPLQVSKHLNATRSPFSFNERTKAPPSKSSHAPRSTGKDGSDRTLLEVERQANGCEAPGEGTDSENGASERKMTEVISTNKEGGVAETQPKFDIVQQGLMDLSSFWLDDRREPAPATRPQSLCLRVELPLLASAAAVDLDVSEQRVVLRASGKYHLDVSLPYPVEESNGRAKFDKVRRGLEIMLPVQRPPTPSRKPFEEPPSTDLPQGAETSETSNRTEPLESLPSDYDAVTVAEDLPANRSLEGGKRRASLAGEEGATREGDLGILEGTQSKKSGTSRLDATIPSPFSSLVRDPAGSSSVGEVEKISCGGVADSGGRSEEKITPKGNEVSDDFVSDELLTGIGGAERVEEEGAKNVLPEQAKESVKRASKISKADYIASKLEINLAKVDTDPKKTSRRQPKLTCALVYDID